MSEYKMLKELLGDVERAPVGFAVMLEGFPDHFWFKPIFKYKSKPSCTGRSDILWSGVNQKGEHTIFSQDIACKEWREPKKKVTKYLWVTEFGYTYFTMAKDLEELEKYYGDAVRVSEIKRLDWSATEFYNE